MSDRTRRRWLHRAILDAERAIVPLPWKRGARRAFDIARRGVAPVLPTAPRRPLPPRRA